MKRPPGNIRRPPGHGAVRSGSVTSTGWPLTRSGGGGNGSQGRGASVPRPCQAGQITSWVCPKQYLALCIKAAFSRNITRVKIASIVERAVPSAVLSPAAPSYEIAILAVGISRLPGRTKDALGGVPWSGDYGPGHRWPCQHRKKDCGNANHSEFRHPYLLLVL